MKTITLPGTHFSCSRFIFGTAGLFTVGRQRQRLNLLAAAVDNGFTHFDTAPYYGFGWAERDLGLLLKSHSSITVTTKVGLYSAGGENQAYAAVFLRKATGRLVASAARPTSSFDLGRARLSLENSLRRLGRDHIAVFMLHEPHIDAVNVEAWYDWLEAQVRAGRVGAYGLAVTAQRLEPFLEHAPQLAALVQLSDSLDGREADVMLRRRRPLQVTYGYVSAARATGDRSSVPGILARSLERNPSGAIIVSTRRLERLAQYRRLAGTA